MSAPARTGVVAYQPIDDVDAIDEYSRRLVGAMGEAGTEARYVTNGLSAVLTSGPEPSWVLLQYCPFSYGRAGIAPGLVRDVVNLRRRSRSRLALMVHEAWVDMYDTRSSLIGLWQRAQLRVLLGLADAVMASTQAIAGEIGHESVHVPVAATITPVATSSRAARDRLGLDGKLTVALFGRDHPDRLRDYMEAAIAAIADAHGASRVAILNLGFDARSPRVPPGVEVISPGRLSAGELSVRLWASDIVLLPLADGVSTRRTTLMAALAHGRPVLGLRGHDTEAILAEAHDAIALTPLGDPSAFAGAAAELTSDPDRLRAIGDAGRRLYQSRFDWPVLARTVTSVLDTMPGRAAAPTDVRNGAGRRRRRAKPVLGSVSPEGGHKAREVVFVAHDVGGGGGMEWQSEQLVRRLLDAGRPVTVITRSCKLEEREALRLVHVPTPRRPFALAYPAFFALASWHVARRGGAIVHTTGAIVANRADVSTVHYCHRSAVERVDGVRASRPGPLYWLNATVCSAMSLWAEAWCYRPGRTRLLCAVSGGLASELREKFPVMKSAVRTVPNGVDSGVFRPDPAARHAVRAELGIDETAALVVFAGGDWERKRLAHAIDALALAPDWHLAVAGAGDPEALVARARAAGTESRVHFLGAVTDMPRLYASGDAFVLPTAYEAFPLVVLEAAASGLPLLVTRVNGVEDLLLDGRNGWFIAPDGRDIARRLNELRSDPELARGMAASARAAATGYSWEAMRDGYLELYAELTNGAGNEPEPTAANR